MATNNIVKQIALNSDLVPHDILAKQLNPITTIGADNVITTDEENTSIVFVNGSTKGRVKLNDKGNISLESDTKHVNIEAAKGIQIKPTTNIIFDSSRRIDAGKGNEVHLQFLDDDFSDRGSSYDGDEYAEVKYEGRTHDIRCYEHGGIALLIAGADSGSYENKIKFESDRTNAIGELTPTYSGEGGKGLEFGTFNNEHASLYTGDYRFKKDAKIYPSEREIEVTTDKTDYKTQLDDFKDILPTNDDIPTWEDLINVVRYIKATLDYTTWLADNPLVFPINNTEND